MNVMPVKGNKIMRSLKVGLVQDNAFENNIELNLELGLNYIRRGRDLGVDIVLFPEMWSNGYNPPYEETFENPFDNRYKEERKIWLENAIDENSSYIREFKKIAEELKIGIVITYLSKTEGAPQNTALVIGKNGEVLMKYSKVHTCDFSLEALLQGGEEFEVCSFDDVKLGIMICYDREFPESARILMLKGAEIILVPNACDMNPARINQLSTRAFENMVGIAMANYPNKNWGKSCAYSPIVFDEEGNYTDNKIIEATEEERGLIIVDFNLDKIREYRKRETWGNAYRKVSAYKKLLDSKIEEPFVRKR